MHEIKVKEMIITTCNRNKSLTLLPNPQQPNYIFPTYTDPTKKLSAEGDQHGEN